MQHEDLYHSSPVGITDLCSSLAPFRGRNSSAPGVMRRPRIEYCHVKKFASELFNIIISKSLLLVQALAPEQVINFSSAACRLDMHGTFNPRATKNIFSSAHSQQTRLSTM